MPVVRKKLHLRCRALYRYCPAHTRWRLAFWRDSHQRRRSGDLGCSSGRSTFVAALFKTTTFAHFAQTQKNQSLSKNGNKFCLACWSRVDIFGVGSPHKLHPLFSSRLPPILLIVCSAEQYRLSLQPAKKRGWRRSPELVGTRVHTQHCAV